ncbi:MAG: 5-guanidino-2-oxopentanoate decarboxylase [Halieaceae bacterium]|jgi:acetolactate synthase I/II/III large subunit|nr:5-guanidino-2-oxopentanoate decarboxylase [Halieaceae bacterium]
MRNCGELLVELLQQYGVDTIFGIPGNHTVQLYRGLDGAAMHHISPRHEQGAGFMADGYARASGRPGVCFLISGPGVTNAVTPMMQALADSVPMLIISAVGARHHLGMGEGHLHELPDQRALTAQCTRFSHTLMRPEELPRVLARAFAVFTSERPGPVHIEIPLDVITADATQVPAQRWPAVAPATAADEVLQAAADSLLNAQRPCIIAGGGCVKAAVQLQEVAERLAAPVINTVNGKGLLMPSHPLAVGGSPSLPAVRELLAAADVVLAIGTEFGETDYDMLFVGDLTLDAQLIRIDIDAGQLCRNLRPTLPICGDACASLKGLLNRMPAQHRALKSERASRARAAIRNDQHYHPQFQDFFNALQNTLPDLIIVGDSTLPTYYAVWQYEPSGSRRYFHSATGGGTLGYAIPAALGAKIACPEKPVVAIVGDGAAQFTLPELAAGVAAQLPVIVIVWNNQGYSEIREGMVAAGIRPIGVDIVPPDFVTAAQAMGAMAMRPQNLTELQRELTTAATREVPTLLDLNQSLFISRAAGQWY